MARATKALTNTPEDMSDALDMAAALAGKGDDDWGWGGGDDGENNEYKGETYPSAKELVSALKEKHEELERLGTTLLAQIPAGLPTDPSLATTQEELNLILLKKQIEQVFVGSANRPANIDIFLNGDPNNTDDDAVTLQRIVEAQYNEIHALHKTDENQDASVTHNYLAEQRKQYERLQNRLDQLELTRSTFQGAMNQKRPVSQAEWSQLSQIDTNPSDASYDYNDINRIAGLNKFYAGNEQFSVKVSFQEMREKQQSLRDMATTLRTAGSEDEARDYEKRANRLNLILTRQQDILNLVETSVQRGNGKRDIIKAMDASDEAAAAIMLAKQEKDYEIIDHASEALRSIYESPEAATREDLLGILSDTGRPETLAQAGVLAKWQVGFTQEGHQKASDLFDEMEEKRNKYLTDATALEQADPTKAAQYRDMAAGLDNILSKRSDIMAVLQENIDSAQNKQSAIDTIVSQNSENLLPDALNALDEQETYLNTSDHIVAQLSNIIEQNTPATRQNLDTILVGSQGFKTIAQAKTMAQWNLESAQNELAEANEYYAKLEELKTKFAQLETDYTASGLATDLANIQARQKEIQNILDDKDTALAKINDSITAMTGQRDTIQSLPNDPAKFHLASQTLAQQNAQLRQLNGITSNLEISVRNYEKASIQGGATTNTSINPASQALPSSAQPQPLPAGSDPATGLPAGGTGSTGRSSSRSSSTRSRSSSLQTDAEKALEELKQDARKLIGFIPRSGAPETKLSTGEKITYGTQSILDKAGNTYKGMDDAYERSKKLVDELRAAGKTQQADSVERELDRLNQLAEDAFQIGQDLNEINDEAKKLLEEIENSDDINEINQKLDKLYDLNQEATKIAFDEFNPKVNAFQSILSNNTVLDDHINENMGPGGFIRRYGGALGEQAVGNEQFTGFLGDAWNSAKNTVGGVYDWWTVDVKNSIDPTDQMGKNLYMGANVVMTILAFLVGKGLYNNTVGKWTGFQIGGVLSTIGVIGAGLFALNGTTETNNEINQNRKAISGFGPGDSSLLDGQGNTFATQTNRSSRVDTTTPQSFTVTNQSTGAQTNVVDMAAARAARSTNHESDLQAGQGRTTSQGVSNSPSGATVHEFIINDDNTGASASTTTPVGTNQTPQLAGMGQQ